MSIVAPQKRENVKYCVVECLPDPMGIVIPKIAWIFLDISKLITWSFFSFFLAPEWRGYRHVLKGRQLRPKLCLCFGHTNISSCRCGGISNSPALTSISSYSIIPDSFERWHVFKWIVISSWHSRNLHTVSEPRKPPQLDFPRERTLYCISSHVTPCLFCVQYRRTGDEIQSHAYFNFNLNWVKSPC